MDGDLEVLRDLRLHALLLAIPAHVERPLRQRHELHPQRATVVTLAAETLKPKDGQRSGQTNKEAARKQDATGKHGQAPFKVAKTGCAEATPRDCNWARRVLLPVG